MLPHYTDERTTVYAGDALDVLRALPGDSVDAIVTDPPYGLTALTPKKVEATLAAWLGGDRGFVPGGAGFMNARWDRFVPPPALWDEALRVLKPGGYLASFAGARTQDLMSLSIRLAGFRIHPELHWLRADAFSKTAQSLKSGYEPIILAQRPLDGTVANNIAVHGTGGLNIEASRTPFVSAADEAESKGKNQHGKYGTLHGGNAVFGDYSAGGVRDDYTAPGRWPTTILLEPAAAAGLDALNPPSVSRRGAPNRSAASGDGWGMTDVGAEYDDEGGPSRFYPKAFYSGRATAKERPVAPDGTKHTTVKPLGLMEWLVRLVTPAGGVVLDMFAGSGTTLEAAYRQGFASIGVEGQESYLPLIAQRIERARNAPPAVEAVISAASG